MAVPLESSTGCASGTFQAGGDAFVFRGLNGIFFTALPNLGDEYIDSVNASWQILQCKKYIFFLSQAPYNFN